MFVKEFNLSTWILKKIVKLVLKIHKSTAFLRETLLISHFGFVSQCKHHPTCSQYLVEQTNLYGWRGFFRGVARLFTCF